MLTRQEGGKGLVGTHKSDMEESEEQEDLEMILLLQCVESSSSTKLQVNTSVILTFMLSRLKCHRY